MTDLTLYEHQVNEIRQYASENGISDSDVNQIFAECFQSLASKNASSFGIRRMLKFTLVMILLSTLFAIASYNHPPTMNLLMRNSQNFIYPGFKFFRQLAVPILMRYPSLTEWYDEWCLLENPYFRVADMDCWPCSSVVTVPDFTDRNVSSLNIGLPFVKTEKIPEVNLNDVVILYENQREVFKNDASRLSSNNNSYRLIDDISTKRLDLFPSTFRTTHIAWRINRMKPAIILRKIFPKPIGVPDWWGQSTERFVFIDEAESPAYVLPSPECSNIVLRCASGERIVKLEPSPECRQDCRTLTIQMSSSDTLWYNWWYWRPVSHPATNSTSLSISYLTSYC